MAFNKSSDFRQKNIDRRLVFGSKTLPVVNEFGEEPYPVILTNWEDSNGGSQIVFSTTDGNSVSHWVAIGVNGSSGSLYAWQPDGSYAQIIKGNDVSNQTLRITNGTLTVPRMSPTQFGSAKLGHGLQIDGEGVLSTTSNVADIRVVANESARLNLPKTSRAYAVIQVDVEKVFYLSANKEPSSSSEWMEGTSTGMTVTGFQAVGDVTPRTGVVSPQRGDYDQQKIVTKHDDSGAEGWFGVDNNGVYWDDGE